jgi:hypothetical protein
MSNSLIFTIIAASAGLFFVGWMLWKPVQDHLSWRREFRFAVRQIKRGIELDNEEECTAGLRMLCRICGIQEEGEQ